MVMPQTTSHGGEPARARGRDAILDAAARLVTVSGLSGLSIGELASHMGMSKSGLYAHFGSKEELQLATVETASEIFDREVMGAAAGAPEGIERLRALCESYLSHLERGVFPGGCFFASAAAEVGPTDGPLRDRVAELQLGWWRALARQAEIGRRGGGISAAEDADQLAFEIESFLALANTLFVLHRDPGMLDRAREAIDRRLSVAAGRPG